PPPSLSVQVPQPVDAAIWRATDPDPARRHARASDFAAAIGAPRRRRVDEALRAATVVPPAAWQAGSETTQVEGPAYQPAGGPAPMAPAPPGPLRPRPTTGRVPRGRPERERGSRWRRRLGTALVALAVVAAAIGGTLAFVASRTVEMPDVVGQPVTVARVRLQANGLRVSVGAPIPSPSVPKGRVARQSVFPAVTVHRLSRVRLFPSAGILMPDLRNQGAGSARATLDRLGVAYAATVQASRSVPAGEVIGSDPPAGRLLDRQQVRLVVSSGPPRVAVPDVLGATFADAKRALVAARLRVHRTRVFSGDVPPGRVVQTSPQAGSSAVEGTVVDVQTSKGPDLVVVPEVRGRPRDEAQRLLQALGFQVSFSFPGFGSRVTDQSLQPGTQVPRGTAITLSLSLF
ncbi:MAG TPA: PASTA domain-containing protein, partial [Actinomycetota bacterium]|nr:PASTA domain-containing protein [Actinomycetota bacterium]